MLRSQPGCGLVGACLSLQLLAALVLGVEHQTLCLPSVKSPMLVKQGLIPTKYLQLFSPNTGYIIVKKSWLKLSLEKKNYVLEEKNFSFLLCLYFIWGRPQILNLLFTFCFIVFLFGKGSF